MQRLDHRRTSPVARHEAGAGTNVHAHNRMIAPEPLADGTEVGIRRHGSEIRGPYPRRVDVPRSALRADIRNTHPEMLRHDPHHIVDGIKFHGTLLATWSLAVCVFVSAVPPAFRVVWSLAAFLLHLGTFLSCRPLPWGLKRTRRQKDQQGCPIHSRSLPCCLCDPAGFQVRFFSSP